MDVLNSINSALEVARLGSFSRAAAKLELSTSSVSRQVRELEQWLGTALFQRTTRQLALTNAGEFLLERLRDIALQIQCVREDASALVATPSGRLRITAAPFVARRYLGPLLPGFLQMYPKIRIQMELSDKATDIVGEGIDLAIRIGNLADSTLTARRIGEVTTVLTASPSFVKENGAPRTVEELKELPCLVDTVPGHGDLWPMAGGTRVSGPVSANSGEVIRDLTLAGLGISLLPDFFVFDDLRRGRLIKVLPEVEQQTIAMNAVYPPRRQTSSTAKSFVEYLISRSK